MTKDEKQRVLKITSDINNYLCGKSNKACIEILTAIADDIVSNLRAFGEDY